MGNRWARRYAVDMDCALHAERLDGRGKRLHSLPEQLPDGCMVARGTASYLMLAGQLLQWTPGDVACSEPPASAQLLMTRSNACSPPGGLPTGSAPIGGFALVFA